MLVNSGFFRTNQQQQFSHLQLHVVLLILIEILAKFPLIQLFFPYFFSLVMKFINTNLPFPKISILKVFKNLPLPKISTREIRFSLTRENKSTQKVVRLRYYQPLLVYIRYVTAGKTHFMWTERISRKKEKHNKMKYLDITNHSQHTQFIRPLERLFKFHDLD